MNCMQSAYTMLDFELMLILGSLLVFRNVVKTLEIMVEIARSKYETTCYTYFDFSFGFWLRNRKCFHRADLAVIFKTLENLLAGETIGIQCTS